MLSEIIHSIILLSIFGLTHSFLASIWFKKKLLKILNKKIAFYRLAYNIFSLVSLIIIINSLPKLEQEIYEIDKPYSYLMILPFLLGIIGLYFTTKYFSMKEFLGISQIQRYLKDEYSITDLDERTTFRIEGPYKYTRHPIYFFSIVILLSIPEMTLSRLIIIISFILYFFIGSIFEERKLIKIYGERYIEYQKSVPRIIPKLKFKL